MPTITSFREKSLLACLITTALIYGGYFVTVARSTPDTGDDLIRFAVAVILQVIALTLIHIGLAQHDRPEPADERDRAIAAAGERLGYWFLSVATMLVILLSLSGAELLPAPWSPAQLLLLGFVLAECVRFTAQLVHYRRGL